MSRLFVILIAVMVIISFSAAASHENNGCSNGRCEDGSDNDNGKGNDKEIHNHGHDKDDDSDDGNDGGDDDNDDGDDGDDDNGEDGSGGDDNGNGGTGDAGGTGINSLDGLDWLDRNFPSGGFFYFGNSDCSRVLILEGQIKNDKYTTLQKLRAERMIIDIAWSGYKLSPKQFYNRYCRNPGLLAVTP